MKGESVVPEKSRQLALCKAEEVQSRLDPDFPSFVKTMRPSHVSGGFWLGLPANFSKKYLPPEDTEIILIDEELDSSLTLYLAKKCGLSAGWRGFSIARGLVDGDALVFHLVNSTTFKIYIIRAGELSNRRNGKRSPLVVQRQNDTGKRSQVEFKTKPTKKKNIVKEKQPLQQTRPSKQGCSKNTKHQEKNENKTTQLFCSDDIEESPSAESASSESIEWSAYEPSATTLPSSSSTTLSSSDEELLDSVRNSNCKGRHANSKTNLNAMNNWYCGAQLEGSCIQCFRLKCELKQRVKEAESVIKESIELRYFRTCKVCMEVDVSMLLMPCKHVCLCKKCEPKLHVCPICNTAKVSSVEVFMC